MNSDRRPGSRLPDDPAYWQNLAGRSIVSALEPRSGAPAVVSPWWHGLSDAAFTLAASALLAMVGGSLLLDERAPVPAPVSMEAHALTHAVAPDDDLLTSLMNPDEPPPATAMLRVVARREVQR